MNTTSSRCPKIKPPFPIPLPRSALIPCDSSHLTKELSIPLVNDWSAIANNQSDFKLLRR